MMPNDIMCSPILLPFGHRSDLLQTSLSTWLDHFRWVAALAVTASHLRNALFPEVSSDLIWWLKPFFFVALFGNEAVVLFFVMSGFLVGGAVIRRGIDKSFSVRTYAIDRAARLYLVLIPALIFSVVFQYFLATTNSRPDEWTRIFANALFLQNFIADPLSNNHPLWSLSSEAWYYIVGPLMILASIWRSPCVAALAAIALLPGILCFKEDYSTPIFGLGIWLLGLIPWFISIRVGWIFGGAPLLAALLASRLHWFPNNAIAYAAIAVGFTVLMCCKPPRPLAVRGARFGASFSYSLYLIHMPIVAAFAGIIGHQALSISKLGSYLIYAEILLFIIILAAIFGHVFERRTPQLRLWLEDATARNKAPLASN